MKTLLLVDDSEADQFLNTSLIEAYAPQVTIVKAYDGSEAIKLLSRRNFNPDLILLDLNMPILNGFEFLSKYEGSPYMGKAPVVVLTSSNLRTDKAAALEYECVKKYLTKPIATQNLDEIASIINCPKEKCLH